MRLLLIQGWFGTGPQLLVWRRSSPHSRAPPSAASSLVLAPGRLLGFRMDGRGSAVIGSVWLRSSGLGLRAVAPGDRMAGSGRSVFGVVVVCTNLGSGSLLRGPGPVTHLLSTLFLALYIPMGFFTSKARLQPIHVYRLFLRPVYLLDFRVDASCSIQ